MENIESVTTGLKRTSSDIRIEDGDVWYMSPSGYRQRWTTHWAKNKRRMWVNKNYIPTSHPLHKPGRYKSWEDAWSHKQMDAMCNKGFIYLVTNPAWPGWVKCGMAVDPLDRVNSFQTASPFRDFELLVYEQVNDRRSAESRAHKLLKKYSSGQRNEWFQIEPHTASYLLDFLLRRTNNPREK